MPYVYSTATCNQTFNIYDTRDPKERSGQPPEVKWSITIKGGANVVDRDTLITPRGVVTKISDEDLIKLRTIRAFVEMEKENFMHVDIAKTNVGKVIDRHELKPRDKSAPLTPASFKNTRYREDDNTLIAERVIHSSKVR